MISKINKNQFLLTLSFIIILPQSVMAQSQPPSMQMTISSAKVTPGSEVELKIFVSAYDPINAFDITLQHSPDLLEFVRARTDRSIASIWQSFPLTDKNGALRLVGGMTTPYSGDGGEIITLIFRAKSSGRAEFVIEKADLALADGKGTLLSGGMARLGVNIIEGGEISVISENKAPATKISEVIVTGDPLTGNSLALVRTENDGGIKETQMRARNWFIWSDWQKTQLLASVPKYAWVVEIRASGWDNSQSTAVIYQWPIAVMKLFSVIALLVLLFFASRPFYRTWKQKLKN